MQQHRTRGQAQFNPSKQVDKGLKDSSPVQANPQQHQEQAAGKNWQLLMENPPSARPNWRAALYL